MGSRSILLLLGFIAGLCDESLSIFEANTPSVLLRTNPSMQSSEGNDFVIAFFDNRPGTDPIYGVQICTKDSRGTTAVISFPSRTTDPLVTGYPQNVNIPAGGCVFHNFLRSQDIFVDSTLDENKAIRITTTGGNGADISVFGVNDEGFTADTFVALPCKTFNQNSYRTPDYKYFVFSTGTLGDVDIPRFFSRVLVIPCTEGTHTITYTLPGGTAETISNVPQYGTRIIQRETDITGTIVTSSSPLAVFTGHLCGQVPGIVTTCDHLIEQIPPHVVYGQTFFVVPMAVRESGDIIKVGSVTDDNQVNVTCTRLTASGTSTTIRTLPTSTINTGGVYEFRTEEKSGGESSAAYKREFCCIETSKPAIVMQYSLGHNEDRARLPPPPLPARVTTSGDPSMNLVPPVSQYKNDYLVPVLNEPMKRSLLESFVGYAIAAEFFDPVNNDERNLMANGATFLGHINVLGSGDYINISCSNGRVCGYGAFGPISRGTTRFAYTSQRESNPGLYAFVTSIGDQVQHAYPAGYECEPIGLPHISVFNITVSENAGTVIVPFQRTGGDLDVASRIIINTAVSADGRAMATTDFMPVTGTELRWRRDEVQPSAGGRFSDAFRVQIVDDEVEESTEYFEVTFTIDSGAGYAFPNIVGRVTILDNDAPPTCDFNPTNYTVEEANNAFVDLIVETNNPDAVGTSCVFSTADGSARAGSDYTASSNVPIQFPSDGRAMIRVPIINDNAVEMTERFIGSLTTTNSRVRIQRSMAQVDITDSDVVSIEFDPSMYSVNENDGMARLRIVKEGMIDRNVVFNFATRDGTALASGDYTATTRTVTFLPSENEQFVSVPITNDGIFENDEMFSAVISLTTPDASVFIRQSTAGVMIGNDDKIKVRFNPADYTFDEDVGSATLTIEEFDRDPSVEANVTVLFSTSDGSATAPNDYEAVSGAMILFDGSRSTITQSVRIINDDNFEEAEAFTGRIMLAPESMAIAEITVPSANVNINDDDEIDVTVQFDPTIYSVMEGSMAMLRLVLSGPSTRPVVVQLSTENGTAFESFDFMGLSDATITFQPGETEFNFTVPTVDDDINELTETFTAVLSDPIGAMLGTDTTAMIMINDNDDLSVQFVPATYMVQEGASENLIAQLNRRADREVTVQLDTSDGSASAPDDYAAITGRILTFPAMMITATAAVSAVDDNRQEGAETFTATLSNPTNGLALGNSITATVTIIDNDMAMVNFDPTSYSVDEGGQASLRLVLSIPSTSEITVQVVTSDGTAVAPGDYQAVTSTVTFPAGQVEATLLVSTVEDTMKEPTEQFSARLQNPTGGAVVGTADTAQISIRDDDVIGVAFVTPTQSVDEGAGTTDVCFMANASSSQPYDVVLSHEPTGANPASGDDYSVVSSALTVTVPAGAPQRQCVPVSITNDDIAERPEMFRFMFQTLPDGVVAGDPSETVVTITDNDPLTVQFEEDPYSVEEGGTAQTAVVLSTRADREVTVMVATEDISAEASDDYTALTMTITFPAGTTRQVIPAVTRDDDIQEGDESFRLRLSNPTNGLMLGSRSTATVNIRDNDVTVVNFDPTSYSVDEGGQASLRLVLSTPSTSEITVQVVTSDGTAVAPGDYQAVTSTVTFSAGQDEATLPVSTIEDTMKEPTEQFSARLQSPTGGAMLGTADTAQISIQDDDVIGVAFVTPTQSVDEGDGTINVCFMANASSSEPYDVVLSHEPTGANPASGDDYSVASSALTVTVPAGAPQRQCVPVSITDDDIAERPEMFRFMFQTLPDGVVAGDPSETVVTITDNDSLTVQFEEDPYSVEEGGTAQTAVVLSTRADREVTVMVATEDISAEAPDDYTALTTMTITFPAGTTRQVIPAVTINDDIQEGDESFRLRLSNPTNGLMLGSRSTATVNIRDNDVTVVNFDPTSYSVDEGGQASLRLVLSTPSTSEITVQVVTSDGTAVAPGDYQAVTSNVTFSAGQVEATLLVSTIEDTMKEPTEQFSARLQNPTGGAMLGTADTAQISIQDDDVIGVAFVTPTQSVDEGDGTIDVCFMANASSSEPYDVVLSHEPTGANPASGEDYSVASSALTVTVPAGAPQRLCVPVSITDDDIAERPEMFRFMFQTLPDGVVAGDPSETVVTITDNDPLTVQFEEDPYSVEEGGTAQTAVVLSTRADREVTVMVATEDISAEAPDDYTALTMTITFPAGTTRQVIPAVTIDDDVQEGDESFRLRLSNPTNGLTLGGRSTATVNIRDNDVVTINFDPTSYSVDEGGNATLRVVLNKPSADEITVQLATSDGSAEAPGDYTATTRTLTFPAGSTEATMVIATTNDNVHEPNETFSAMISMPSGQAMIGMDSTATINIRDNDDLKVRFEQPSYTVIENEGPLEVCGVLSNPASQTLVIRGIAQESSPPDAKDGEDFGAGTAILTFSPGQTRQCAPVAIIDNNIVEKREEGFELKFEIEPSPLNPTIDGSSTVPVTIIDDDSLEARIEQPSYTIRESEGPLEVCGTLSNPAAETITLIGMAGESSPPDARDGEDFIEDSFNITFLPGETRKCASVMIVDDQIVEKREEDFEIEFMLLPTPLNATIGGPSTIPVTIIDDDMLSIRFKRMNYTIDENEGPIEVCVEKVGQSAEDITIQLMSEEKQSGPGSAKGGEDFSLVRRNITIRSDQSEACINISIIDDRLAMEGDEAFQVTMITPPNVPSSPPDTAMVIIKDNDKIDVSFLRPFMQVDEDVGRIVICFEPSNPSARPYTVMIGQRPYGPNPASLNADYSIASQELTVEVPAGMVQPQCINTDIIDDNIAMEGNETFRVMFTGLPEGVFPGGNNGTTVEIVDNDVITVEFVTRDVVVNENNGTVFVCVNRSSLSERPLTVPIAITKETADPGSDFEEKVKNVTFAPGQTTACAEIPVINDNQQEIPESFSVGFGTFPPGSPIQPGLIPMAEVIIMDDDGVSPECRITEPLMVNYFSAQTQYRIRGTCELIAVQSCNDTQTDFSVRVDFLRDDTSNGAVGIFKDGLNWVSRQDGSFSTTSTEQPTGTATNRFYASSRIRVMINSTEEITTLRDDEIGITVTHSYGANPSIVIEADSSNALQETCGICGTQNGQLLQLDGTIARTMAEIADFVESYRVPARDQSLRPQRPECGIIRNDTVIGDPLYTVPILTDSGENLNLCFEIHGSSNSTFNLISDECVSVNAYYSPAPIDLNIISAIGVKAEGLDGFCRNIQVDLEECAVSTGSEGGPLTRLNENMLMNGISIRQYTDRVRIALPNCDQVTLVLWVICERGSTDMIRFQVARGLNLRPTSHGLLGQFWNVPVMVQQYTPPPGTVDPESRFNVTVVPANGSPSRSFQGERFPRTWDNTHQPCLYAGNIQGGPDGEFSDLSDSVIEGRYKNYKVASLFETSYDFSEWESDCAPDLTITKK